MTYSLKYKKIVKTSFLLGSLFLKKIFSFKHSKWNKLKSIITKRMARYKRARVFKCNFIVKGLKFFEKHKKAYKFGNKFKVALFSFFDYSLGISYFKKCLLGKSHLLNFLIRPFFKLDILLWKLHFFENTRQARVFIRKKKILVNNSVVKRTLFLKDGDVVCLKNFLYLKNSKFYKKIFFTPFCEVDYYSNTIILFKKLERFSNADLIFLYKEPFLSIRKFIYYLRKN